MAKTHGAERVRLLGVTGRSRSDLLRGTALQTATMFVLSLPAAAQLSPNARPVGETVRGDTTTTIARTETTTTIKQLSQRTAIDWRGFDVGSKQLVTFAQPSPNAVALNRVTGPDPSRIAGTIKANGQVVLVNQAGVTFFKGAQVNAQSFIVTTSNIPPANFMAGGMTFEQGSHPNARIVNRGEITVQQAGLAALVAPRVANTGIINAKLGHVVLAGAKSATLDLYGDGLLSLDVTNQITQAPMGRNGAKVEAFVTNSGIISADGGTVQLTAAAADGVLQNLVRAGGKITANTVGSQTGTVTVAGIGGSVSVTGVISAAGRAQDTMGGAVAVNATGNVVLANTARINASGRAGGGTVAIGTTLQRAARGPGTPAAMTAANVGVVKGARIKADATAIGNGGNVTVLSGGATLMSGSITAKGGQKGGDGGAVEISGDRLGLDGFVDVLAPVGRRGVILLDPTDLDIIAAVAGNIDTGFVGNTLPFTAPDGSPLPSTVSASKIQNLGSFGNVVIQATGTIGVQTAVTVAGLNPGTSGSLSIQAGGNLTVRSGASIQVSGNLLLEAGATFPGNTPASGAKLLINDTVSSNGNLQLKAGAGGIMLNGNVIARSGVVDLNATGGGVTQLPPFGITADILQSSNGVVGTVSLLGDNVVRSLGAFAVTPAISGGGDFLLKNTTVLTVDGQLSAPGGNVFLRTSDPNGLVVGANGGVTTGPNGRVSIQTDQFLIATDESGARGIINTGTFELAPVSQAQTVTLGNFGTALALPSLDGVTASLVRVGAVTKPGATGPDTTATAITVGGTFSALNHDLELDSTVSVFNAGGPLTNVATLSGRSGTFLLTDPGNTIATLGNLAATNVFLTDSINLTVAGVVNVTGLASITDTGTLTVSGGISANVVNLNAGNIAIPGFVNGVTSVDLVANVGTISETGTLFAGTLLGSAVGVADLSGAGPSANQVGTIGSPGTFSAGGGTFTASDFVLRDGVGLTVAGTVTATNPTGQIFLESTAPAGITIAATGAVVANTAGGKISLQADSLVNNASVTAAAIEVAPATAGSTVTLGATGAGLSLASAVGLSSTNLVVGAATPFGATTPIASAGSIAINGTFAFTGQGALTLDAASTTAPGANGAVTQSATQSAPLTVAGSFSGTANSFNLLDAGNSIPVLTNVTATSGDLNVASTTTIAPASVSARSGNIFLESAEPLVGIDVQGPVTAFGRVGIHADHLRSTFGSVNAATFELAPFTAGLTLTPVSLSPITAATVRLGAVTLPGDGTPTTTAGAVKIGGAFTTSIITTLELDASSLTKAGASGAITQTAPLINVATLIATGDSVVLANSGNQIAASSGITATNGDVVLVDGTNLSLSGTFRGNNLFFEVASAGGSLIIGGARAATLATRAGARTSLVADSLTATVTGSIGGPGGTVELAPFSAIPVSMAGSGGRGVMLIDAGLLASIDVGTGTLVVGGFSNPAGGAAAFTTTAAAISLDGAVNLAGRAGTLVLGANGPVTEPIGPLTVGTVTGTSVGDFFLGNAANNIQASTGITAAGGDIFLADDPTLLLTGLYSGNNLYFHVTLAGGSIGIGDIGNSATLVASPGGTISVVADGIAATSASTITAPGGTLEVAPFSAINESVAGTSRAEQLLVDGTLLADITGGGKGLATLLIGEYTTPRVAAPTISAASITIDGALDLTVRATYLDLIANGPVAQRGGPITASNVFGQSVGNFALTNPANAISQYHSVAAVGGDAILVSGADLNLSGTQSGNNVFIEVARAGGTLSFGAGGTPDVLTAASGGRISLIADRMTQFGGNSIAALGGTLELAPFSAINASLLGTAAGQLNIGQPLLSGIVPGLAMLAIGGFTNVPAGASVSAPSAASISVDGAVTIGSLASVLNFQAIGAVTQVAPILNVATLVGTTGRTTLDNANNTVATLGDYTARNGFALTNARDLVIAGIVNAGPFATFTVAGALTETGGITAGALSGSAAGTASFTGNNTIAGLNGFSVSGAASAFSLNDRVDLLITRTLSANRITISDPTSRITLGDGAAIVTGGSVRPANTQSALTLLPSNGGPGALFQSAQFSQSGRSTVNGLNGPATLQVSVSGDIQFDTQAGLVGPATWLVLNMIGGNATGNVAVSALDISYRFPGGANLFGSIAGVSGTTAASLGFIQAQRDPRFLFNACEIGIVSCQLVSNLTQLQPPTNLTVVYVPIDALLALVSPALVLDPDNNDNLLQMPVVSKEDY